ncbi:MAG: DUF4437 domain-containing protein [Rhizobiaceae bacterium]|nr:DUF4437 domain-containing protein [Rhizobiaceae bacterium]
MSYHKLALAFIGFVSSTFCATSAHAIDDSKIINMPSSQLNWETTKEGVGFAPLQGDRFNEAYMAMVKLPAGLVSPAHIKTANMYGLVVSGTIANAAVGADPASEIELPTGSYYKIPAGLAHVSKCVSKVDCLTFLYQDGKFDFLPVSQ